MVYDSFDFLGMDREGRLAPFVGRKAAAFERIEPGEVASTPVSTPVKRPRGRPRKDGRPAGSVRPAGASVVLTPPPVAEAVVNPEDLAINREGFENLSGRAKGAAIRSAVIESQKPEFLRTSTTRRR
jgi:hypothetical protein